MSLSSLKGNLIAIDTETTGLNPWNSQIYKKYGMRPARPFAFSFCDSYGNKAFIRWEVDPMTRKVVTIGKDIRAMSELLGDPDITKVGHNISFDIRMVRLSGIKFNWKKVHDSMFMAHVLTGGSLFNYGLKPLSEEYLDIGDSDLKELMASVLIARRLARKNGWAISNKETHGREHVKSDMWLGDPELCKKYALLDAERTMLLYLGMRKEFEPALLEIYKTEMQLTKVVYRMEGRGVRVFPQDIERLKKFYGEYREKWRKIAEANGGKGLNFNSPKQLVNLFCVQKKYKTRKHTNSGQPSVDGAELARMAKKDILAKAILEYKAGDSMLSKFMGAYERFMALEDGIWVLHPNFHQCGTKTGRFSCSDPNLQQAATEDSVKKKADLGLKPRETLGVRSGHVWYLPDFSQMEVWIFAFAAKDKILMNALLSGQDVHEAIAKQVWGTTADYKRNKKLYRKKGKTMMFLKLYGGTSKAASELMDCSRDEAQIAIDEFDYRLPGVNTFIKQVSNTVEQRGYIENLFGRQYYIDRHYAYRAVNYFVQGTCADIIKRAMVRLWKKFNEDRQKVRLILTIHDELPIEVPKLIHSVKLQKEIIRIMQADSDRLGIPVPLPVTMKISENRWSDAKEI